MCAGAGVLVYWLVRCLGRGAGTGAGFGHVSLTTLESKAWCVALWVETLNTTLNQTSKVHTYTRNDKCCERYFFIKKTLLLTSIVSAMVYGMMLRSKGVSPT